MRTTTQSSNGTSFYGTEITTTLGKLRRILGTPDYEGNDGQDKSNIEWVLETDLGGVFTVYDWKEYRRINENDMISWHIGGMDKKTTEQAKKEISAAIRKILK